MVQNNEDINAPQTNFKTGIIAPEELNTIPQAYRNELLRLQNIITRLQTENNRHFVKTRHKGASQASTGGGHDEMEQLRKELEHQERLITSYQLENERLCAEIKESKQPAVNRELEQTAKRLINENTSLRFELESVKREYKTHTTSCPLNLLASDGPTEYPQPRLAELEFKLKEVSGECDRTKAENRQLTIKVNRLLEDNQCLAKSLQNQRTDQLTPGDLLLLDQTESAVDDVESKRLLMNEPRLLSDQLATSSFSKTKHAQESNATLSKSKSNRHVQTSPKTSHDAYVGPGGELEITEEAQLPDRHDRTNRFPIQLDEKSAEHVRTLVLKLQTEIHRMKQELFKSRRTMQSLKSLRCAHCSTPIKQTIGKISFR